MSFIRRNRRTRRALVTTSKAQITPSMKQFRDMLRELSQSPLTLTASVVRDDKGRPTGEFEWQDSITVENGEGSVQGLRGLGKSLKSMAGHMGIVVDSSDGYDTPEGRTMDISVRRAYTADELAQAKRPRVSELLAAMPTAKDTLDAALTEYLALDQKSGDEDNVGDVGNVIAHSVLGALSDEGNDEDEDDQITQEADAEFHGDDEDNVGDVGEAIAQDVESAENALAAEGES